MPHVRRHARCRSRARAADLVPPRLDAGAAGVELLDDPVQLPAAELRLLWGDGTNEEASGDTVPLGVVEGPLVVDQASAQADRHIELQDERLDTALDCIHSSRLTAGCTARPAAAPSAAPRRVEDARAWQHRTRILDLDPHALGHEEHSKRRRGSGVDESVRHELGRDEGGSLGQLLEASRREPGRDEPTGLRHGAGLPAQRQRADSALLRRAGPDMSTSGYRRPSGDRPDCPGRA